MASTNKRQVIFDLDGTLLNTLEDLADSVNHICARHGYPEHPLEAYRYFVGNGAAVLLQRAIPQAPPEERDALLEEYSRYYEAHSRDKTRPYEGMPEALRELRARGLRLAVLSNKPHAAAAPLVESYYPGLFQFVQGALPGYPTKPDPALLLRLLETLGGTKEETLFVGDSEVDIHTAKNGGLASCGVLWGFRGEAELREAGAEHLVSRPEELLELL